MAPVERCEGQHVQSPQSGAQNAPRGQGLGLEGLLDVPEQLLQLDRSIEELRNPPRFRLCANRFWWEARHHHGPRVLEDGSQGFRDLQAIHVARKHPVDDDQIRNGNAMVIDPFGDIIAECNTLGNDITVGCCVPDKLERCLGRKHLAARRPELYGDILAAPNPDAPPFVGVGDSIGPETVVCLVEAMKIFNEIKAECSGTVEKVMVSNGDSVEFGQPLFKVRPS